MTADGDQEATGRPGLLGRVRRVDPMLGVVLLVAWSTYLLSGLQGRLLRDPSVYLYAGQLIADGAFPYEDLLNRTGPLAQVVPALGVLAARATGLDEVLVVRTLYLVVSGSCVGVTYLLGRDLLRSQPAGVAAAAALLVMQPFLVSAVQGPREKTLMVLFLLGTLLAASRQKWVAAGVLVALGTLTWQPVFFVAFVAAVVAALLGARTGRLHALARIVAGGAVPALLAVVALALGGHLRTALDAFLLVNLRYTDSYSPLGRLGSAWDTLQTGYGWTVWVFWAGLVATFVAGGVTVATDRRRTRQGAALVGVAASLVPALLWTLRSFDSYPDTFLFLPGAALGIGAVAAAVVRCLPGRAGIAAAVAWSLLATSLAAVQAVQVRDDELLEQRRLVTGLLAALPPDARVGTVSGPQALVLSGRHNHSRYVFYGHGVGAYIDDTWPGGKRAYARWFVQQDVEVIAVSRRPPWFEGPLDRQYVEVGVASSLLWLVDRDLGPDVMEAARRAVRDYQRPLA